MRKIRENKLYRSVLLALFSFFLGCMLTVNLTSIEKPCVIENEDREYNIMQNSKLKNPELIILVLTSHKNLERRTAARESWLRLGRRATSSQTYNFKHYFVIGSRGLTKDEILHLSAEQSEFSDILALPMHDSYHKLTEKVLKSFEWLSEQFNYGLEFKYVLKCDDDTFVNLPGLLSAIPELEKVLLKSTFQTPPEHFNSLLSTNVQCNDKDNMQISNMSWYWGYFNGNARIKSAGKWKETDWIACDNYIPYALGGGYILSKSLVTHLANNAAHLRHFNSEDVSVGLWLSPVNNLIRIHDIRMDSEWTTRGCKNYYLLTHSLNVEEMRTMAANMDRSKKMCSREREVRRYHLYDWSVPPSRCCKPA